MTSLSVTCDQMAQPETADRAEPCGMPPVDCRPMGRGGRVKPGHDGEGVVHRFPRPDVIGGLDLPIPIGAALPLPDTPGIEIPAETSPGAAGA